jgi:hypothetical protein
VQYGTFEVFIMPQGIGQDIDGQAQRTQNLQFFIGNYRRPPVFIKRLWGDEEYAIWLARRLY